MDFQDELRILGERVEKLRETTSTEEATKTAFILPFIKALGFDIFNPMEVIPEFTADIGTKKGEKVDYAIVFSEQPLILMECKHWREKLTAHNSQLVRYFHVTKAKFAILTNGITYQFFSDIDEPNLMDEKPFFEFKITDMKDSDIAELKRFHKSYLNIEEISTAAQELKYLTAIKSVLQTEMREPSDDFIKFLATRVSKTRQTQKFLDSFSPIARKATLQFINEAVNVRLKSALEQDTATAQNSASQELAAEVVDPKTLVVTTEMEKEAFFIVKAILRELIDSTRISYRDTKSYFSVLLDDNNRKCICRLYLEGKSLFIGVFDSSKVEKKHLLTTIDEIYTHRDALLETTKSFL